MLSGDEVRLKLKQLIDEGKYQNGVIAFRIGSPWTDERTIKVGQRQFEVAPCRSPLEVREALVEWEQKPRDLIVLTEADGSELGADVLARLARHRVVGLDMWESVRALFQATEIEHRVLTRKTLAEDLLKLVPPSRRFSPSPSGLLDLDHLWNCVICDSLEFPSAKPSLSDVLDWTSRPGSRERFLQMGTEMRTEFLSVLEGSAGAAVRVLFRFLEYSPNWPPLVLAHVCSFVFGGVGKDHLLSSAAVRMEFFTGKVSIPVDAGIAIGNAAASIIATLKHPSRQSELESFGHRVDDVLRELQIEECAYLSDISRKGWKARLTRFAQKLKEAVEHLTQQSLAEIWGEVEVVRSHAMAAIIPEQLQRMTQAVRLVGWLLSSSPTQVSFRDLALQYIHNLAWVDLLREDLSFGDEVSELSEVYGLLQKKVRDERERFNLRFSSEFVRSIAAGAEDSDSILVYSEHALERVVAPIAKAGQNVLVLILDGMSWPVCLELLPDLRRRGWSEIDLSDSGVQAEGLVSPLPSVTQVARASLLAGKLVCGLQSDEKELFAKNQSLLSVSGKSKPVVFHKADLTDGPRGPLSRDVRAAVTTATQRIVAVVVNAVDDKLSGAQQVRDHWNVETIRPLGALLEAAAEGKRVVVLTSDHGHIVHVEQNGLLTGEGGERWRKHTTSTPPKEGELLVQGPRVLTPSGESIAVVPWQEDSRYAGYKSGYHGGATPQEVLAPLLVLGSGLGAKGESRVKPRLEPEWFVPGGTGSAGRSLPSPIAARLHQDESPGSGVMNDSWVVRLLASAAYARQKRFVGKKVPDDKDVSKCLRLIEELGLQSVNPAILADRLGFMPIRFGGFMSMLSRILNIDGYAIINHDQERNAVTLNLPMLKKQFELGGDDGEA